MPRLGALGVCLSLVGCAASGGGAHSAARPMPADVPVASASRRPSAPVLPIENGACEQAILPKPPPSGIVSRDELARALATVIRAACACSRADDESELIITIVPEAKRVSAANVTGEFAGTPVGSCVARAVRGATFPRFSRPSFVINNPFRI